MFIPRTSEYGIVAGISGSLARVEISSQMGIAKHKGYVIDVEFLRELDGFLMIDVVRAMECHRRDCADNEGTDNHVMSEEFVQVCEDHEQMLARLRSFASLQDALVSQLISLEQLRPEDREAGTHEIRVDGLSKTISTIGNLITRFDALHYECQSNIKRFSTLEFSAGQYLIMNSETLVRVEAVVFRRFYVSSLPGSVIKHHYVRGDELKEIDFSIGEYVSMDSMSLVRIDTVASHRFLVSSPLGSVIKHHCVHWSALKKVTSMHVSAAYAPIIYAPDPAAERLDEWRSFSRVQKKNRLGKANRAEPILHEIVIEETIPALISEVLDDPAVFEMVLESELNHQRGRIAYALIMTIRLLEQQIREETARFLESYLDAEIAVMDNLLAEYEEGNAREVERRAAEAAAAARLAHRARVRGLVQEGLTWEMMCEAFPEVAFHMMNDAEREAFKDTDEDIKGVYCQLCFHPINFLDPEVRTVMCCRGNFQVCGRCRDAFVQSHEARLAQMQPNGLPLGHPLVMSDVEHFRQGFEMLRGVRR